MDVTADDGVRHELWVIDDGETVAALTRTVDALPALYIADGHHRSAAAERVAKSRGDGAQGYFLTVMFPQNEMTILDYNRVIRDLNGHSPDEVLALLRKAYAVAPSDKPLHPAAASARTSRERFRQCPPVGRRIGTRQGDQLRLSRAIQRARAARFAAARA